MNKSILKNYKNLGVKTLKLSQIKLDQGIYPRFETDEERAKFFAKLLEEGNEFEPVIVAPTDTEGLYELLDGNHRLLAHQIAGYEEIRAEIYDVPKEERRLISAGLNNKTSKPLSEGELKDAIVKAYTVDGIKDLKKIASLIGCSLRTVERYTKEIREREREELIRKAVKLREKGLSIREIARELGIPKSTIEDWLSEKQQLSQMGQKQILLLTPSGALSLEGLKLWSEYVEQADIKTPNDAFNESMFFAFLKNKGYEEVKHCGQFIASLREIIDNYVKRLVDVGMSETAIRTALSKENKGVFNHISSTAKAKLAGLLKDYIRNLIKEREKRQKEENLILETTKEILQNPEFVFSSWYNLGKLILERLEEKGQGLSHKYHEGMISEILQKHSNALLDIYKTIPEISEEELKQIAESFDLEEFEDLIQFRDTLRATVIQKGKRPAGVDTLAVSLWNEYQSKKIKKASLPPPPSSRNLEDSTVESSLSYEDEEMEEYKKKLEESWEKAHSQEGEIQEPKKRGPKGPHKYKSSDEKPQTPEEILNDTIYQIQAYTLFILSKFGRKKAIEVIESLLNDLETLSFNKLYQKWNFGYFIALRQLGIETFEYWREEV